MRRLFFAVLAVLAVALIAGCGSSGQSAASSPTVETLSYFPPGSPFVLMVPTDPKSPGITNARALEQRFPQAALLQTALFTRLGQLGIDYNKDVKPLYGNPFAIGVLSTQSAAAQTPILGVWVTKSQTALSAVIKKLGPALQGTGTHDGAKLYATGGEALAIDGPTVLIARTAQDIEMALDRHKSGHGFSAAEYGRLTSGIGGSALVQLFGDVTQALSMPKAAQARKIPWVAAIKGYGASIDAAPRGLTIQFHLDTTGRSLSPSELPFAAGASQASVAGTAPIQTGIRDLVAPIAFLESSIKAIDPGQYDTFTQRVNALKRRAGFDLNAFIATLSGTLDVSSDTKTTIARIGVSNPSAVSAMLKKLTATPALAFSKRTEIFPLRGGLYHVHEASGSDVTLGVVGSQLLFGKASPAQIRAFAQAPTANVPGASGSVVFRVALLDLLHLTLKQAPSPAAQQFLNLLGDLTGSMSTAASGLTGTATLAFR